MLCHLRRRSAVDAASNFAGCKDDAKNEIPVLRRRHASPKRAVGQIRASTPCVAQPSGRTNSSVDTMRRPRYRNLYTAS